MKSFYASFVTSTRVSSTGRDEPGPLVGRLGRSSVRMRKGRCPFGIDAEADTPDRDDEPRVCRVRFEFGPETVDVGVEGPTVRKVAVGPEKVDQLRGVRTLRAGESNTVKRSNSRRDRWSSRPATDTSRRSKSTRTAPKTASGWEP